MAPCIPAMVQTARYPDARGVAATQQGRPGWKWNVNFVKCTNWFLLTAAGIVSESNFDLLFWNKTCWSAGDPQKSTCVGGRSMIFSLILDEYGHFQIFQVCISTPWKHCRPTAELLGLTLATALLPRKGRSWSALVEAPIPRTFFRAGKCPN